jgi:hypothetical protein
MPRKELDEDENKEPKDIKRYFQLTSERGEAKSLYLLAL